MTRSDGRPGEVAKLIRAAQDRHGVTYREIERRAHISKASVSDYAAGRVKGLPKRDRLIALAGALRVPVGTLLHAFLVDLGLDILELPAGTLEQAVMDTTWLADDERDLVLRQLEMFRRERRA